MPFLSALTWVDWLVVVYICFSLVDGWTVGFVQLAAGFGSFIASIWLAAYLHLAVGTYIIHLLGLPQIWIRAVGFLTVVILSQLLIVFILTKCFDRTGRQLMATTLDNILGAVLSLASAFSVMTMVFILIMAVPGIRGLKNSLKSSLSGRNMLVFLGTHVKPLEDLVESVAREAISFRTVDPESKGTILLDIRPQEWELKTDTEGETLLLNLVNSERIKNGTVPLSADGLLTEIARAHSRDMLLRHYFSHYDPEGHDVKDRSDAKSVTYGRLGENLAYAGSVESAMTGLMSSEGHRRNILDPQFTRVGIGIVDAGIYGKMVTQVFADQPYLFLHY